MAKLSAAERAKLPASDFALPETREFPIEDKTHAEQAIRMSGHRPGQQKRIEEAARKKFPAVYKSGMRP